MYLNYWPVYVNVKSIQQTVLHLELLQTRRHNEHYLVTGWWFPPKQHLSLSKESLNTHACDFTGNSLHWFKFCAHFLGGSKGGAVVRALISLQCGRGWNPGINATRGLTLLLVLSLEHSERFFSGYSGFPLSLKTYTFKIPIQPGTQKYISTSTHELLSALWVNELQLQFQKFLSQFNFCFSLFKLWKKYCSQKYY